MQVALAFILTIITSYLIGSINTAIIVTRIVAKKDIRDMGSGNAGLTNVLRTMGKLPAFFTLIGDVLKGVIAVLIGKLLFSLIGNVGGAEDLAMIGGYISGFFAMIGHVFPAYYRFKGGKGILVSVSILLVIDPIVGIILIALFAILVIATKMVSVGSIAAALSYPIVTYILHAIKGRQNALIEAILAGCIGAVIVFMHRHNIKRIINGTENKLGK